MQFGTAIHEALEVYWRNARSLQTAIDSLTLTDYDLARARSMLVLYDNKWSEFLADKQFEIIGAEVPFEEVLFHPTERRTHEHFTITGRIDLVLRINGYTVVVEHKTSSEDIGTGSQYRQRLLTDSQVSQYLEGYPEAHFVIWDVLKKPDIKPLGITKTRKQEESYEEYEIRCLEKLSAEPDRYHALFEVHRNEVQRERFRRDLWATADLMTVSRLMGIRDRNESACFAKYPCQFVHHCAGMESLGGIYEDESTVSTQRSDNGPREENLIIRDGGGW